MSTETSPQQNQLLAGPLPVRASPSGVRHRSGGIGAERSGENLVSASAVAAKPSRSRSAADSLLPHCNGLPPLAAPGCKILVLGSLPGAESLRLQQYYAHPRNYFWEMMGTVCRFPSALPYPHRLRALIARDIAVWDVLASGHRPGSLDSAIDLESAEVNPFESLLRDLPTLQRILFNGALAERLFVQRVLPSLSTAQQAIARFRLPSTSPANASVPRQAKLDAWRAALEEPE